MRRKRIKTKDTENTRENNKKIKVVAGILGSVILLSVVLGFAIMPGNAIAKGVSVDGINVGGMTIDEAQNVLSGEILDEQKITLTDASGEQISFAGADINLSKDAQKTAETAFEIGRNEGFFKNVLTLIKTFISHTDIDFAYGYDKDKLSEIVYNFGVSVNGEQKNYDLEYGDGTVTIKKGQPGQSKDVTALLSVITEEFTKDNFDISIELKKTEAPIPDVQSVYDEIYAEAKDAEYEIINGELKITPEIVGRNVDKKEIKEKIDGLQNGKSITVSVETTVPEVTAASINKTLFGYTLGEYSSSYASSTANRASNVELAANKINGIILMPNEEFSYNKVVGNRTVANGFKEAPVFENGETVQGMGGGVCQVSSTLYSAVLYADLQVTERRNHSMTVAYVPKGQDATVAYGSIDFKFKNNTKNPVKISTTTAGRNIKVSILSAKPEKEKTVKIINTVTATKEPTNEEVVTAGMKAGERKRISSGKTGYTISTTRVVYENGKEVKSEKMKSSTYKMVPNKFAVGAEAAKPAIAETEVKENEKQETQSDAEIVDNKENETEEITEE